MRVIDVTEFGGPDVLRPADHPEPAAVPGRVRIRSRAATVNPADAGTRAGAFAHFLPDLRPPFVLGWDVVGTVVDDGAGFTAGQRVAAMIPWFAEGGSVGGYAEVVSLDPAWVAAVPDGVADAVAATVPLNGLTATQAVALLAAEPGSTVAVTGASGAVGGFAAQLLVAAGVHVVAVASRSDEAFVSALGVQAVVTRDPERDLADSLLAVAPGGVDRLFDPGAAGDALLRAVRDSGMFVAAAGPPPEPERGIHVGRVEVVPDVEQLRRLLDGVASGLLATRVADVVPLAAAAEAHRRLEAGGFHGKLVLDLTA